MVFSRRDSAFAASPASSNFLPSSVSRSEAARWGDVPGVILASNELSSGSGPGVDSGGAASGGLTVSFTAGGAIGVLVLRSCSLIFDSWGKGVLGGSSTGDGGATGGTLEEEAAGLPDGRGVRYTGRGAQFCVVPMIEASPSMR
jgi:hypothetical protein